MKEIEEKWKEEQKRNIGKENTNRISKITGKIQQRKSYKYNVSKTRRRKKGNEEKEKK